MKSLWYILFSLLSGLAFSQNQNFIDSLELELQEARQKSKLYNRLGEAYISNSPKITLDYAGKALESALKEGNKIQMAQALWLKARVYLIFNEYAQSNHYLDTALILFEETQQYKPAVNCKVMKASTLMLQGEYNEALELFGQSAKESERLDAKDIHSSVLLNIGRIYRARGEYEKSKEYYEKSLAIAKIIDHQFLIGNVYFFLGELHQSQQEYASAIDNYLLAIPIYEENNFRVQISYLYSGLGLAYRDSKNFTESLKYFKTALAYFLESNDRWGLNELHNYLGSTYLEMNQLDSAWIYYQNSLALSIEINDKAAECNALHSLGEILLYQKKSHEAMVYLEKALALNKEIENKLMQTKISLTRGMCLIDLGFHKEALEVLRSSLKTADSLNLKNERMLLHKQLSKAHSRLKNHEKALRHYEKYSSLHDSIYREESNRHFVEMERKYKSEKQKQEISQLNLEKAEQEITIKKQRSARNIFILGFLFASITGFLFFRSYKTKKKADQEKEALLKEIHHRVKNNLQIISSLLSIQTDNLNDTKVINAVQESQSRVKAMALIHQLLYQDKDLAHINFGTYLPQLVNALSSIFKKDGIEVITEIDATDIAFDIDTAVPLGLIVAELASNAFKYAFNGKTEGLLKIKVEKMQEKEYLLSVADNGPGLPKDTHIKELDSMGLRLVNILTDQLDGVFNYNYNNGAVFTVRLTNPT